MISLVTEKMWIPYITDALEAIDDANKKYGGMNCCIEYIINDCWRTDWYEIVGRDQSKNAALLLVNFKTALRDNLLELLWLEA